MVINVSHVTLGCENIRRSSEVVQRIGFQVKFIEETLPNAIGKKPFLQTDRPTHALSFCQHSGGIALELVDHFHRPNLSPSAYKVLFRSRLLQSTDLPDVLRPEGEALTPIWKAAFGKAVGVTFWEPFKTPYWHWTDGAKAKSAIHAVLLKTAKIQTAHRFWVDGIGCRVVGEGMTQGKSWLHLKLHTPVSVTTLHAVLCEWRSQERIPYLDDAGFSCLAFLTLGLERVSEALVAQGASASGKVFSIQVGGRSLKGQVLRGPSDELVELIEIERQESEGDAADH